ncbi:hypothetical protein AeRB84_016383 [Aphanomyces euteiches]|nr:hypothetical protein AeRB84_016383 [Aphanomyces euteiches]
MLRDQLHIKNSSLAEAVAQRDSHEEDIRTLKKLNQGLNGALTELKHCSAKLESQLEIESASKMALVSELQALTEQLLSERREHDALTMHVHFLSQRQSGAIHERDVKCKELSLECRRIAYELQAAIARYENTETTINAMQLKVEDHKKENRNLSTNIDRLESLLRDERAVVEAKDTILAQAKMELAALRHKAALAEDKTIEAIKEANALKQRMTLLRHDPSHRFEAPVVAPLSMAS